MTGLFGIFFALFGDEFLGVFQQLGNISVERSEFFRRNQL